MSGNFDKRNSGFINLSDKMPDYGEPIILRISGVVQHITYMTNGSDDCDDWIEPYFFDSKEFAFSIDHNKNNIEWMYVDDVNDILKNQAVQ